jgi:hypothetical protein
MLHSTRITGSTSLRRSIPNNRIEDIPGNDGNCKNFVMVPSSKFLDKREVPRGVGKTTKQVG